MICCNLIISIDVLTWANIPKRSVYYLTSHKTMWFDIRSKFTRSKLTNYLMMITEKVKREYKEVRKLCKRPNAITKLSSASCCPIPFRILTLKFKTLAVIRTPSLARPFSKLSHFCGLNSLLLLFLCTIVYGLSWDFCACNRQHQVFMRYESVVQKLVAKGERTANERKLFSLLRQCFYCQTFVVGFDNLQQ